MINDWSEQKVISRYTRSNLSPVNLLFFLTSTTKLNESSEFTVTQPCRPSGTVIGQIEHDADTLTISSTKDTARERPTVGVIDVVRRD